MEEIPQYIKDENFTPLYPYDGRSQNLIDKFYIFGYNYLTLKKYLLDQMPEISVNAIDPQTNLGGFQLIDKSSDEKTPVLPSVLSEITNDFDKEILDTSVIQNFIFPNNVTIYYMIENDVNTPCYNTPYNRNTLSNANIPNLETILFSKIDFTEDRDNCPVSHRVTFSCNPFAGGNKKRCQNGFAYTFYRKFLKKKKIGENSFQFYVPYTFCIISEFPFFYSYEKLFRCIRKMFYQPSIYIPIEIILYKIVTLTPSPVNTDVILDLEKICKHGRTFIYYNDDGDVRRTLSSQYKLKNNNKIYMNEFIIMEDKEFNHQKKNSNKINEQNKNIKIKESSEFILEFNYLSGYPLIQYNLAGVLFNSLSVEGIIKIFLFSFLESDIIFFSEKIELLTFTLNAFLNFNYPLNDAEYFYNIVAISLEQFKIGDCFGRKNCSSMIAINNKYVNNYLSKTFKISEHIVVDLDEGNIFIGYDNNKIYLKISELISNICEGNAYELKNTIIYRAINNLNKRLNEIEGKKNIYQDKDFIKFNYKSDKGSIDELNKSIQEAFYECVINLSLYAYENFMLTEEAGRTMKIEFNSNYESERNYMKEELLIIKELKETMKFRSSLSTFVMEHNPIDLYKIPLTFMDEFISFISRKRSEIDTSKIKYFKLIDKLYLANKLKEVIKIDFSSDIEKYLENYKDKFIRDIEERNKKKYNFDYSAIIKVVNYNQEKCLRYQTYELDDQIILDYIYIIMNLSEGNYLRLISDNFAKEDNIINEISITEIETRIDKYCLYKKYLSMTDLCATNIVLLFSISLKLLPEAANYHYFLTSLFQNFPIFRKYHALLLQMIFKLYRHFLEKQNKNKIYQMKMCFFACLDYIRNYYLIPNENLMIIINKFLKNFFEEKKDLQKRNSEVLANLKMEKYEQKINDNKLFIMYNFTSAQFYQEKDVINKVNLVQNSNFYINVEGKEEVVTPRIRFNKNNNEKKESLVMSQQNILDTLKKEYDAFYENLDITQLNKNNIIYICLNILIFMKNEEKFKNSELSEIWNVVENIFFIFSEKKL